MLASKRILMTGGRGPATLDLARQFSRLGHEVHVAESRRLHFCTFSNAVKRTWVVPSPLLDEAGFVTAMESLLAAQSIDYLIPTYDEVYFIAKHRLVFEKYTTVFCDAIDTIDTLNNKQKFMAWMDSLGMNVPETRVVQTRDEYIALLEANDVPYPHILKPVYTGGGVDVLKIKDKAQAEIAAPLFPSLVQEFIEGDNYCTFGIAHHGVLSCHATYRPIYIFRENGAAVCFEAVEDPEILAFASKIVSAAGYTGILGFDMIKRRDGKIYAIECNPRITNGIHLVEESDRIDMHFFGLQPFRAICPNKPRQVSRAAMLRILGVTVTEQFGRWFHHFVHSKEVMFDWRDPLPGLALPLVSMHFVVEYYKHRKTPEQTIFYNVDWSARAADPNHTPSHAVSSLFCKLSGPQA